MIIMLSLSRWRVVTSDHPNLHNLCMQTEQCQLPGSDLTFICPFNWFAGYLKFDSWTFEKLIIPTFARYRSRRSSQCSPAGFKSWKRQREALSEANKAFEFASISNCRLPLTTSDVISNMQKSILTASIHRLQTWRCLHIEMAWNAVFCRRLSTADWSFFSPSRAI